MATSNTVSTSRSKIIASIYDAYKEIQPRILFARRGNKFVPVAQIYPKSTSQILKRIKSLVGRRNYYQAIQDKEEEIIRKFGHGIEISIYSMMKARCGFQNRVKDFKLGEISKILKVTRQTLSHGITELEKAGVIKRVGHQTDRAYYINPDYYSRGLPGLMIETIKFFSDVNDKKTNNPPESSQKEWIHLWDDLPEE